MHRIYRDWDDLHVVACSKWIASRANQCGELAKRDIYVIHNGIDNESVFQPLKNAKEYIASNYNLPLNKKYVLFVSPGLSKLKGFDLFLELVDACTNEGIHFILVGGEYESRIDNLTAIGKVSDAKELARFYSAADGLVMCSRSDNYPTVCLEAISCGTPVVGFDVGCVKETISDGMGESVAFGDITKMKEALLRVVSKEPDEDVITKARCSHSKQHMASKYLELYYTILNRHS